MLSARSSRACGDGIAPARVRRARDESSASNPRSAFAAKTSACTSASRNPSGKTTRAASEQPAEVVDDRRIDLQDAAGEMKGEERRQEQQRRRRDRDQGAPPGARCGAQAREIDDEDGNRDGQRRAEQGSGRRRSRDRERRGSGERIDGQPPTHCMSAPPGLTDGVKSTAMLRTPPASTRLHVQIRNRSSVGQAPDRVGQADVEVERDEWRLRDRAQRVERR